MSNKLIIERVYRILILWLDFFKMYKIILWFDYFLCPTH